MPKGEERLSLREAADALGVSEVTARRWVKAGKLKAHQPGRKYLIPSSAVDDLLESDLVKAPRRSSPEPSLNDALEDLRRTTERFNRYHAIQRALDEYRELWETRLAEGDFDKAAMEEGGRALEAFWPAVTAAADAELAEGTRFGTEPDVVVEQSVLIPAIRRFQALCDRVNVTYREKYAPDAKVYAFPHREAS